MKYCNITEVILTNEIGSWNIMRREIVMLTCNRLSMDGLATASEMGGLDDTELKGTRDAESCQGINNNEILSVLPTNKHI